MNIRENAYQHDRKKKNRVSPGTVFSVLLLAGIVFVVGLAFLDSPVPETAETQVAAATSISATETPSRPYALSNITFPSEGQAAIGTLRDGVLEVSSQSEQLTPMASMTKVITALAILQKAPIEPGSTGDIITLTEKDEQYFDEYYSIEGTITAVIAGQQMSQYEALQAMLLPSSNNMSDSLVDRYFDSREEYLLYANAMLAEFGLVQTYVADASGFSPSSVSIPSEMIVIGQKALQNPIIAGIVAQPTATIAVGGDIRNYNALIYDEGVTGIKPGSTDEAGLTLLFSADAIDVNGEKVTIIGAVMGITDYGVYLEGSRSMIRQAREQVATQSAD
jgi:D-alanyl-D-alanine carboxypeptidase (penicillin-binding protein 5/6)